MSAKGKGTQKHVAVSINGAGRGHALVCTEEQARHKCRHSGHEGTYSSSPNALNT